MNQIKVKDNPGLVRDSHSKAIINIDKEAYNEYKAKRNIQDKVLNLENDIKDIKQVLEDIKLLIVRNNS